MSETRTESEGGERLVEKVAWGIHYARATGPLDRYGLEWTPRTRRSCSRRPVPSSP